MLRAASLWAVERGRFSWLFSWWTIAWGGEMGWGLWCVSSEDCKGTKKKREKLWLVHVIYIYIKGICVHYFGSWVGDKWTANRFKVKNRWVFYGHNYGLSFPATPGTLCGLNIIPIQYRRILFFLQCDPRGLQIRWVSVPSIIYAQVIHIFT